MSTTQHPLTKDAAAGLWDGYLSDDYGVWHRQDYTRKASAVNALRAAFNAGREHERETPAEPLARTLLGVPEGYGAPHHDADRIKPDDSVAQMDENGFIRAGIAHHQDEDGDWRAKNGRAITWAKKRADRPDALTVWPAPTPPTEEVEMPGEPRRLTYVVLSGGEKIAEATWTGASLLYARHPLAPNLVVAPADQIEQWTLDGTRVRRDGDHPDGKPRFVKEGEK